VPRLPGVVSVVQVGNAVSRVVVSETYLVAQHALHPICVWQLAAWCVLRMQFDHSGSFGQGGERCRMRYGRCCCLPFVMRAWAKHPVEMDAARCELCA
jgi:hypothetical protein